MTKSNLHPLFSDVLTPFFTVPKNHRTDPSAPPAGRQEIQEVNAYLQDCQVYDLIATDDDENE